MFRDATAVSIMTLIGLCWAQPTDGDTVPAQTDRRIAPGQSAYYAVARYKGALGPMQVTLARSGTRAKRPLSALLKPSEPGVVEGDEILAQFAVRFPSRQILVSTNGYGCAVAGVAVPRNHLTAPPAVLVMASGDGRLLARFTPVDLFGAKQVEKYITQGYKFGVTHVSAWIDEPNKSILIVGARDLDNGHPIAVVSFKDGRVRAGTSRDVDGSVSAENHAGFLTAVATAADLDVSLDTDRLARISNDGSLPMRVRVCAASVAARHGNSNAVDFMKSRLKACAHSAANDQGFDERMRYMFELATEIGPSESTDEGVATVLAVRAAPELDPKGIDDSLGVISRADFLGRILAGATARTGPRAVECVREALGDHNRREWALDVVRVMGEETKETVPAIVEAFPVHDIEDWPDSLRYRVASALAHIGTAAHPAAPLLRRLSHDREASVRELSLIALEKIQESRATGN